MNLVLPERYGTATDLQYRRRIQARQHGLQYPRNEGELGKHSQEGPPLLSAYIPVLVLTVL